MQMRPVGPSPHLGGVWPVPRIAALVACLCAMLALFASTTQAQTKLDVRKLFAEHLQHAVSSAALETRVAGATLSFANTDPVPIPGGINIPPVIHIFAPGPVDLGFQGFDVELNGITNFQGFSALGYLGGMATDSNGNSYAVGSDMRVFQGEYVSADGSHHHGTFVFI